MDRTLAAKESKFSIIHAEIPLNDYLQKTFLGSQVHLNFPDAITNSKPRDPATKTLMKSEVRRWADPGVPSIGRYPFLQNLNMEN